ncbi:hypothetical protein PMAYCL1PPCAC_26013, partial [Pristionchus mayeri]
QFSLVIGAFLCFSLAQSYKILVFAPRYSQSINNFLGNIADTLVEEGHDVTTLIPIAHPKLRDGTHKSKKIYVQPTDEVKQMAEAIDSMEANFFAYNDFNPFTSIAVGYTYHSWINAECNGVVDEPGLISKLKDEQYDVMIVETFEACGAALSHLIKPKSLITSTASVPVAWMYHEFGLDLTLSYNPNMFMTRLHIHSIWSRLANIYAEVLSHLMWSFSRSQINGLFRERFEDFPGLQEICSRAAYTFINSETLVDYAVPTFNRVIYIGGIGAKEPKKLDKELDSIFSLRNKTVLMSFGSVVATNQVPLKVKESMVEVVSRFPEVTFLWKYESPDDEFAKKVLTSTANLHMIKWTPQNDILADDRMTAFITHGGMSSTQEIALRGKPGLFVPFMGDQRRNAGMMEKNGVGRAFDKNDLFDANKFYAAVKDLLENESYRQNAERISSMIKKKPFSARESLVKTVEFAAEFGPSPALRPQSLDMNWIEYLNVDIVFIVIMLLLVLGSVVVRSVMIVIRNITGAKEKRD